MRIKGDGLKGDEIDRVTKTGLDVRRVAAIHAPMPPWDNLREAVEKKRARR